MGSEKYVLGIDGGTGGIRAGLFAVATGEPIAFADTPYDTSYPKPGHAEQSPSDWWDGLGASSRKVLRESGIDPRDVAGVCVDTTCCTVVALDADANALRPAILWMDMRASDQTKQVLATRDRTRAARAHHRELALALGRDRPQVSRARDMGHVLVRARGGARRRGGRADVHGVRRELV